MNKLFLRVSVLFFFIGSSSTAYGQSASLYQNFDVACATGSFPAQWLRFNPLTVMGTFPDGAWICDTNAKNNTPCLRCSNYFAGDYHIDTAFLITPLLNFNAYSGQHLYLQFDTKSTKEHLGAKLSLLTSPNGDFSTSVIDLTSEITPVFGIPDSTDWTTHQFDLTSLLTAGDLYFAFRYIAPANSGSKWYLDNVTTTATKLASSKIEKEALPLHIIGTSTSSAITVGFSVAEAGRYTIEIYDMLGRNVHTELVNCAAGETTCKVNGLALNGGMYLVKVGNEVSYGLTKTIVQ